MTTRTFQAARPCSTLFSTLPDLFSTLFSTLFSISSTPWERDLPCRLRDLGPGGGWAYVFLGTTLHTLSKVCRVFVSAKWAPLRDTPAEADFLHALTGVRGEVEADDGAASHEPRETAAAERERACRITAVIARSTAGVRSERR
ncbi:MAG TPA: hypothetical protein VFC19_48565 [Candidatus Limnocylindrales bacterium]|nr:hypothetical protein [Candidatus Limnocylindrales bacterium]